jgi:hypothetical protein
MATGRSGLSAGKVGKRKKVGSFLKKRTKKPYHLRQPSAQPESNTCGTSGKSFLLLFFKKRSPFFPATLASYAPQKPTARATRR